MLIHMYFFWGSEEALTTMAESVQGNLPESPDALTQGKSLF